MENILRNPEQDLQLNQLDSFLIRGLDLIGASLGLILLTPLFLIIVLAIKFTSEGPIFYMARRVGQGGCVFGLYKFRSMYVDADRRGPAVTVRDDPRVTPVGRFLRRAKLDELPQLINVLRGEMSLVGPRPEDPRYVAVYTPEQRQVLAVRPGMTSLASRHYRDEEKLLAGDDWNRVYREQILPRKLTADLAYLKQRSFWTDVFLILETIGAVSNGGKHVNAVLKLRNRHFFLLDILALMFTPAIALTLRLDGLAWWPQVYRALVFYTAVSVVIKIFIFHRLQLYNRYWRYAGVSDLSRVLIAVGLSTFVLTVLFMGAYAILQPYDLAIYRAVPLIDGLMTLLAIGGSRVGMRALYHWHRQHRLVLGGRRTLVVGSGEAGTMVVREMRANPQLDMEPVAFVDDDPAKTNTQIQGLPVLGSCEDIPRLVDQYQFQRIVVAMPSAPLRQQQKVIAICKQTGVPNLCLPGVYEILAGSKTISCLPSIDINRLLHREPVDIDQVEVGADLDGATVLVTGAGGSIGGELCRWIARFDPAKLILLGHGENSIFEINLDLRQSFPHLTTGPVIVDVRDQNQVNQVVREHRPEIVFHAAAHKHVPFMETWVAEAITNNILGTYNVLQAARQYGVRRFVLISTDKAVNPTSIMGASKRIAELLVMATARCSGQAYMAVRFGNVLGSRGSVLPVFQRQIAAGGPVTVTHPDMCRYFMTIPEAVQLVLQASVLGQGGEIFVLDMGRPIRILDMATELIKLSGLRLGRDIEIIFSGVRSGEKLNEELFLTREKSQYTIHPKIFVATDNRVIEIEDLEQVVIELVRLAKQMQGQIPAEQLRTLLLKVCYYIDQYHSRPHRSLPEPLATSDVVSFESFYRRPSSAGA